MSNEQKPSDIRFDEAIDSLGIGLCDRPEFRWKVSELLARVRREARAEAFEQAGWACLALSEGADQSVQCAKRIAELAAKERAS